MRVQGVGGVGAGEVRATRFEVGTKLPALACGSNESGAAGGAKGSGVEEVGDELEAVSSSKFELELELGLKLGVWKLELVEVGTKLPALACNRDESEVAGRVKGIELGKLEVELEFGFDKLGLLLLGEFGLDEPRIEDELGIELELELT
jgi:hypothetical protein